MLYPLTTHDVSIGTMAQQNGQATVTHAHSDKDGHFRRKDSVFRDWISADPNSKYPAEAGRYVLYMNYGCPWAHRASIVRALKGLEDIIEMVATDFDLTSSGWTFTGLHGSVEKEPVYGFTQLREVYLKVEPGYTGRFTVPCLFDRSSETIVRMSQRGFRFIRHWNAANDGLR